MHFAYTNSMSTYVMTLKRTFRKFPKRDKSLNFLWAIFRVWMTIFSLFINTCTPKTWRHSKKSIGKIISDIQNQDQSIWHSTFSINHFKSIPVIIRRITFALINPFVIEQWKSTINETIEILSIKEFIWNHIGTQLLWTNVHFAMSRHF